MAEKLATYFQNPNSIIGGWIIASSMTHLLETFSFHLALITVAYSAGLIGTHTGSQGL